MEDRKKQNAKNLSFGFAKAVYVMVNSAAKVLVPAIIANCTIASEAEEHLTSLGDIEQQSQNVEAIVLLEDLGARKTRTLFPGHESQAYHIGALETCLADCIFDQRVLGDVAAWDQHRISAAQYFHFNAFMSVFTFFGFLGFVGNIGVRVSEGRHCITGKPRSHMGKLEKIIKKRGQSFQTIDEVVDWLDHAQEGEFASIPTFNTLEEYKSVIEASVCRQDPFEIGLQYFTEQPKSHRYAGISTMNGPQKNQLVLTVYGSPNVGERKTPFFGREYCTYTDEDTIELILRDIGVIGGPGTILITKGERARVRYTDLGYVYKSHLHFNIHTHPSGNARPSCEKNNALKDETRGDLPNNEWQLLTLPPRAPFERAPLYLLIEGEDYTRLEHPPSTKIINAILSQALHGKTSTRTTHSREN